MRPARPSPTPPHLHARSAPPPPCLQRKRSAGRGGRASTDMSTRGRPPRRRRIQAAAPPLQGHAPARAPCNLKRHCAAAASMPKATATSPPAAQQRRPRNPQPSAPSSTVGMRNEGRTVTVSYLGLADAFLAGALAKLKSCGARGGPQGREVGRRRRRRQQRRRQASHTQARGGGVVNALSPLVWCTAARLRVAALLLAERRAPCPGKPSAAWLLVQARLQ